jgi:hypothetical protein
VAQVYQFNGTTVVGGPLYTSAIVDLTTSTFSAFTFSPDITLTPGTEYVALVTNDPNGVSLGGYGGGLIAAGTATTGFTYVSGNLTNNWCLAYSGCPVSAEFNADFSANTPLPAALLLFASGLAGLGLLGWRRKRKAVA